MSGRQTKQEKLEAQVRAWTYPIGQDVTVKRDDGSLFMTRTRSEPWVLGERVVIQVKGIAGGYLLERVTPRHTTAEGGAP